MVRRDGALQVAGVVTWGGETLGRRVRRRAGRTSPSACWPHLALRDRRAAGTLAPYAERRVRVRRTGKVRRCVIGAWHPGHPRFTVRWFRRDGSERRFLPGTRPHAHGPLRPDRLHRDRPHGRRLGRGGVLQRAVTADAPAADRLGVVHRAVGR